MTDKELQSMTNAAQSGSLQPDSHLWQRVENRLESNNKDLTIKRLTLQKTLLAIASCVLIVTLGVMSYSTQQTSQEISNYSSLAKTPQNPSSLYDVNNVRKLNRHYN